MLIDGYLSVFFLIFLWVWFRVRPLGYVYLYFTPFGVSEECFDERSWIFGRRTFWC